MKKVFVIIGVIAVVAIGVFVYQNKAGSKYNAVRIGAVLPLTGNMAPYGLSLKRGINIAVEEVNASGGINGRRLEVVYEDSQGDPRTGVSAFNKLHLIDRVPLVLGSLTGVIMAIRPEADRNSVVLINTSAISPLINDAAEEFLFNLVVNGESEAMFLANELHNRAPNERIAIFYGNTSANVYTANVLTKSLDTLGHTNHFRETYEIGATDFRLQLDRIRRSGARNGFMLGFGNHEYAEILRQSRELNMDIQWFSTSSVESRETIELAGEAANGIIYSYPRIINNTLYSNFQTKYRERFETVADLLTVSSYDAVLLIAEVMNRFGITGVDIQNGLRTIDDFYGIFGRFKLSGTGRQFVDRELLLKTVENGQFRISE